MTSRMHPPGAQQTFGLGSLVGPHGLSAPSSTQIEVEGRGVFAKVRLTFEFSAPGEGDRLFLLEKPSDAVPSVITLNDQPLSVGERQAAKSIPGSQLQAVEEALDAPSSHLLVVELSDDVPLQRLFFEFVLAVDLQWHRGAFLFRSPEGTRAVEFSGRWELAGLPGAGIAFTRAASSCRLETLEAARHRWSQSLSVGSDEPAVMEFSLDEKKAASIAVFSPGASAGPGCAAVAVVAPVRPQLARDPVRLAILVEVRNPQEGLLVRNMVERAVSLLKAQDEFCVLLVGTDSPGSLVPWSASDTISDELLARLLEPEVIGRAPDLWGNLQSLGSQLRGATHLLLASSGTASYPGKGLVGETPVFIFATGRRPFKSQLESLSQRSGGFLMEGTGEGLESLLDRMRIRLSPPLLSDFKLEGWALTGLRPAAATQVYTDQPTLVLGLFEGLLPKTVTLSGQSPSRQKLAQRVKVENLEEIDLLPLYQDRVARWDGESDPIELWTGAGATVRNISHVEALPSHYAAQTTPAPAAATSGMEMDGPPSISFAHSAVTFDDTAIMTAPALEHDPFFGDDPTTMPLGGVFEGAASSGETDLFFSEPSPGDSLMGGPVTIRKAEPFDEGGEIADEIELFQDPMELNRVTAPAPAPLESGFEFPVGPPIIQKGSDDGPPPPSPAPSEPSTEEASKRRLLSWRQKQEQSSGSPPAPAPAVPERPVREPLPDWSSEWLEAFLSMDPGAAEQWLESCSIDHLGLAASLLEPEVVEGLLARLSPHRRRAVRTQMEWGRLLEGYECEQADHQLALSLTQHSL